MTGSLLPIHLAPLAPLAPRPALRLAFAVARAPLPRARMCPPARSNVFFKKGFYICALCFSCLRSLFGVVPVRLRFVCSGGGGAGALAPKPPRAPFWRAPAPPPPRSYHLPCLRSDLLAMKPQPLFSLAPYGVCGRRLESGESRYPELAAYRCAASSR